jgi:2',3'-cyclic-nucleotide 2'-phosphodiesterase (5'-nucleotidase family)
MLWSPPGRTQQTVDLVILHVNDSHGALSSHLNADSIEVGGAARAATLIREVRKQHSGRVLVLHAGDLFSR